MPTPYARVNVPVDVPADAGADAGADVPAAVDPPLRVAYVVDSDAWGGAEVYVRHLLRHASGHGVAPVLVCAEQVADGFADLRAAVPTRVVPLARHRSSAPPLLAALRDLRPGVVHVNLVDPGSNAAALAAAQAVAPTVATLHLPGDVGRGAAHERLQARFAALEAVLSPSEQGRAQLVDELGVADDHVHVVANGVPVPAAVTRVSGDRLPRLGALGRLTRQKGFDVLLEAMRLLVGDGLAVEAAVGGRGRDAAALRSRAAGLAVDFAGFVDDVPGFLAGLDVFVLPSRHEAMPFALLEAMAAGLPCVATDVGDVRSAVGGAAVVVPPGDPVALAGALRPLLAGPAARRLREDLGLQAHRRALSHLDVRTMAARTYQVIRAAAPVQLGAAQRPSPRERLTAPWPA